MKKLSWHSGLVTFAVLLAGCDSSVSITQSETPSPLPLEQEVDSANVPVTSPALVHQSSTSETNGKFSVTGGTIVRSLEDQIGAGMGDWFTPSSSSYIIHRDPLRSVRRGRQLFQRKFSQQDGIGPRVNFASHGDITQIRSLGAGSSDSCSTCHGSPKGSAGFGGNVATFPDGRDAPHLFGLGIIEQLADEITTELRTDRDIAVSEARTTNSPHIMEMWAKEIHYGRITAYPDGSVDSSELVGIDSDLRVKPFFAQGKTISMREFIIGAFKDEMGMESWDPILCAATDPDNPQRMVSESGFVFDPALDTFERPPVCDESEDNDGDGITAELDPALIDHMEFYLLNYFKPATGKQNDFAARGEAHLENLGCTSCHIKDFNIYDDRRVADVETTYDSQKGIFNGLYATATGHFNKQDDGHQYPALVPNYESFAVKKIYTDFKRHDLGPKFHERDYDGTIKKLFMTEPLWGVGSTAPYGHDGRSIDLDQVIRRHGGEAQFSTEAYIALTDTQQLELQEYLRTLQLFPPDDTASNLNPGVPDGNPQTEHGSIKLPVLFQIPGYGSE